MLTLGASLVVTAGRERALLSGVDRHEPPVAELERHLPRRERAEVDSDGAARRAQQGPQLVEQARARTDPIVLDARAQTGERDAVVQRAFTGEREAERDGERG